MKVTSPTKDPLFRAIEKIHEKEDKRFGVVLDAGTGGHSLRWLSNLPEIDRIVAVSADLSSGEGKGAAGETLNADRGDVLVQGSWCVDGRRPKDVEPCDTILADYLIGSMDGFTPFAQDRLLEDILPLLKPDGFIHLVGLQPIYTLLSASAYSRLTDAQKVVVDTARVRDACILLARHRPYREFPLDWIERQLTKNGLELIAPPQTYGVVWKHATIKRQLDVARRKLPLFESEDVANAMRAQIDAIENRAKTLLPNDATANKVVYSFDYVVSARRTRV